jgi:hypothetical protein
MKQLFILFIALTFVSCNKSFYKHDNIPKEGKYYKKKGFVRIFMNIENKTAYIDVISYIKRPEDFYSDTINFTDSNIWQGRYVTLNKKNRKFVIVAPIQDINGGINENLSIKMTLKRDTDNYIKNYDFYKNESLINKVSLKLAPGNKNSSNLFLMLYMKHDIMNKTKELSHSDFIIEYKKFEQELIKELELLKEQE